jgi:DNA repair photolyase
MSQRIANEIKRKRKKPLAVYFCPSCDPFQPLPEVQQISFEVMKILLENGVGIQFVTKGRIPDEFFNLFEKYCSKIAGQIGLIAVDDKILSIIEPNAAKAQKRLEQIERLIKIGVKMSVRCDPMIYGVTDTDELLQDLFSSIAKTGCREAAISYLFLRPAIISGFKKNIADKNLLDKILGPFSESISLPIGLKNSTGTTLPLAVRKSGFERVRKIADSYGVSIHLCGCKNRDITDETCYITRPLSNGLLF